MAFPKSMRTRGGVSSRVVAIGIAGAFLVAAGLLEARAGGGRASEGGTPASGCARPYSDSSPWNTRLGPETRYHPRSAEQVAALGRELSSDPDQYTYPVYEVTRATPEQTVRISGWLSNVGANGETLTRQRRGTVRLRVPPKAESARGTDAQVVVIDRTTGEEWGAWRFERHSDGSYSVQNAYRYNIRWDGVPPSGFGSRGAGVTYLAGLVRPCEITRGRIDHALAFAYDYPTKDHIFPATKSDGTSDGFPDVPEGARLQLDPRITPREIRSWECTGACFTIARALQEYGMYVIDNSGRPKVMLEYRATARWPEAIGSKTVRPIPLSRFKLVEGCTITGTDGSDRLVGTPGRDYICALGGNDIIVGGAGGDIVYAGAGHDRIAAGPGNDIVYASLGNDRVDAGRGADRVLASEGDDVLLGRDRRRDTLSGGPGRDRAHVDRGLDRVIGIETTS